MEVLTESPVHFTKGAIEELQRLMAAPGFDPALVLRIGAKGGGCSGLSYLLNFEEKSHSDGEYEYEGLRFVMNSAHEMYLQGMQIDWEGGLNSRGFMFLNPNASKTCGCGTSFSV